MDFSILHDPLKRIISDFFDAVAKKYDIELGLILKTFEELQFKKNICSKCGIKGVYNYEDNDYGVRCIKCKDGSMVNLHTKKYTERRFRKKIEELGGKVMGKYKGNNIPVDCICPEGHSCNPRPSKIQQGRGMCIVCACRDPVTAEKNFRICIEEIGGKVMGEYKGNNIPVDCICPEGHPCNPRPASIQQGGGMCIVCACRDPVTAEKNFRTCIEELGGKVMGEYKRGDIPVDCICPEGHSCNPRPASIQQGGGMCIVCAKKDPVTAEKNFRICIEELGGKVMGEYKGTHIPVDCICPEGHSCNPMPGNIQRGRGMCIVCACRDPVTAEKNFRICIEEIGGKVMGEYKGAHIPVDCICPEGHSCNPMPGNIQRGRGMCIRCSLKGYSNVSIKWLNIISIENDIEIIHAINEGEHTIANSRFRADGYCKETNTIYEFDGCYWHGHECKYHPEKINSVSKKTFGELYEKTLKRHIFITQQGYNLVQIWECDFNAGKSYSKIVSAFSDKEIRIDEVDVIDDEILEFDEDLNDIFGTFDDTHYCV